MKEAREKLLLLSSCEAAVKRWLFIYVLGNRSSTDIEYADALPC
jgi:hypothetical protein